MEVVDIAAHKWTGLLKPFDYLSALWTARLDRLQPCTPTQEFLAGIAAGGSGLDGTFMRLQVHATNATKGQHRHFERIARFCNLRRCISDKHKRGVVECPEASAHFTLFLSRPEMRRGFNLLWLSCSLLIRFIRARFGAGGSRPRALAT